MNKDDIRMTGSRSVDQRVSGCGISDGDNPGCGLSGRGYSASGTGGKTGGRTGLRDTRTMVQIALLTAVTCVLAPISIPLTGNVPISLATFAVMLSGALLGAGGGAVSQILYLLIGMAGVPVFAGWTAGAGKLLGVTGGYLIGYVPMAFAIGFIYSRFRRKNTDIPVLIPALIAGEIVLYVLGTAWFMVQSGMNLQASLAACVIPFIPGDILKMIAVCIAVPPIAGAIRRFTA